MRRQAVRHWLRSLHAQLILWAVLPLTFVIIALAFTGVYAHQRMMRDFVASRSLALARLTARMVEDGLAHGVLDAGGIGLPAWMPITIGQPGLLVVIDAEGRALAHSDSRRVGDSVVGDADLAEILAQREGVTILLGAAEEPVLVAFAEVGGTGWVALVQEPVAEVIGPILRLPSLVPIVAGGAGILSLLVLTFGWRTIVRPLQQLAREAEQVSWGDFSAISEPVGGVQEVRDLHRALGDMVERIRGHEAGMRDYLGAVTLGQEAERARLARELHDGPVQELIALGQRAEMAQRLVERQEIDRAQEVLGELRRAELDTVAELRDLIGDLRPIYLEDLGFLPALEMLVQQAAGQSAARVRMEQDCVVQRLAPEVELASYRIVQEALNNALQHAQATSIIMQVHCDLQGFTVSVTDDGVGFELPRRPDLLTRSGHFGLVGMRERATLLGGTLHIWSKPGEGTRITARLPSLLPAG
jgi:signal transduction histidine kinase